MSGVRRAERAARLALPALPLAVLVAALALLFAPAAADAAAAPDWLRALASEPTPAHSDEAEAVTLYSEVQLTVLPNGRMKRLERVAYRILRPNAERRGVAMAAFDSQSRVTAMRGWCVPTSGKDYEVRERDAVEVAIPNVDGSALVTDTRVKLLMVPAALPGNLVGYETEVELQPYAIEDLWDFQDTIPVREARYSLRLPPGWNYQPIWLKHTPVEPVSGADGVTSWVLRDLPAIRVEDQMPPWRGVAARMALALVPPPSHPLPALLSWRDLGTWYQSLLQGRLEADAGIRQKVAELTAGQSDPFARMNALASYVQRDVRYVAIELGVGGYQPHRAAETFANHFGDCKDKAALLATMLREAGIDSALLVVNTVRGNVSPETPTHLGFNHVILAIRLPATVAGSTLPAAQNHPTLGRLLIFDPTDEITPLGRLRGALQGSYGLLVAPTGGELLGIAQQRSDLNGFSRHAEFSLDANGRLRGTVGEALNGDFATDMRRQLKSVAQTKDRIRPIESKLADTLPGVQITQSTIANLEEPDKSLEWHYSVDVAGFARRAGDLLLLRPRVIGSWTTGLMEAREPRAHPVEFDGPSSRSDTVTIALPEGYVIDELPVPVDVVRDFAAYHARSERTAGGLRYTRTLEYRQLSVPVAKADELRQFYRFIAQDERATAVLAQRAK